jgi:hypothetical protein
MGFGHAETGPLERGPVSFRLVVLSLALAFVGFQRGSFVSACSTRNFHLLAFSLVGLDRINRSVSTPSGHEAEGCEDSQSKG